METIINDYCFEPPEYEHHYKQAQLGMLRPEPDKLKVGHFYYRIGHSHRKDGSEVTHNANLASGWWLEYETYSSLMQFAERNGISMTVATRVRCAVAPAFGKSNRIYRAQLAKRLRVFIGAGRPIESDGHVFFPPGDIKQIYIPGMANNDRSRSNVSHAAFPTFTCSDVSAPVMLVGLEGGAPE